MQPGFTIAGASQILHFCWRSPASTLRKSWYIDVNPAMAQPGCSTGTVSDKLQIFLQKLSLNQPPGLSSTEVSEVKPGISDDIFISCAVVNTVQYMET